MKSNDAMKNDTNRYFVRITAIRKKKFVEFNFSINEPEMFVELILSFDQYKLFCEKYQVETLTPAQEARVDADSLKWRYGQPDKTTVNNT